MLRLFSQSDRFKGPELFSKLFPYGDDGIVLKHLQDDRNTKKRKKIKNLFITLAITHSLRLPIFANFLINQKRSALLERVIAETVATHL